MEAKERTTEESAGDIRNLTYQGVVRAPKSEARGAAPGRKNIEKTVANMIAKRN